MIFGLIPDESKHRILGSELCTDILCCLIMASWQAGLPWNQESLPVALHPQVAVVQASDGSGLNPDVSTHLHESGDSVVASPSQLHPQAWESVLCA